MPRPAQAGGNAGLSAMAPMLAGDNIAYLGLAFAALGIVWLLMGLIYRDLFPALALTAAGIYCAADMLRDRNILPAALAAQLKPLGMPIAAALALLAVLHLFLGSYPLF